MSLKSPVHFLLREKYANLATDNVIELILSFIKDFMGDESSNSEDSVEQAKKKERESSICVLIFDNASIMDEESWSLLLRVHD